MTYDAARQRVVMFGGWMSGTQDDTLWEWDGAAWTQHAVDGPTARVDSALAFDPGRHVVVLHGGTPSTHNEPAAGYETWEWDGAAWTRRTVVPGDTEAHAMANDSARGEIVLFGGPQALGDESPNTYVLDSGGWRVAATDGPSPRSWPGMAYDSLRGVTVLAGGAGGFDYNGHTWEWNGVTWTLNDAITAAPDVPRLGMVFDEARGVVLTNSPGDGPMNETWSYDGVDWTRVSTEGPSLRERHAMAYDRHRGVTVLFGGVLDDPNFLGDTWEWDGQQWELRSTTGPSPRFEHAMAYDPLRRVVVMSGGVGATGTESTDVWEWDGISWQIRPERLEVSQFSHAMAYDELRRRMVLVGDGTWAMERTILGDVDKDHDVDTHDFALFTLCFGGANAPPPDSCPESVWPDFDDDGDVDLSDYAILAAGFTGSL
jgi:hypothetical protein